MCGHLKIRKKTVKKKEERQRGGNESISTKKRTLENPSSFHTRHFQNTQPVRQKKKRKYGYQRRYKRLFVSEKIQKTFCL